MAKSFSRCVAAAALAVAADAANWAVIMAGSRSYYNYRHQADACHAYHVAADHGVPASNIILMSYDDIASSSENPFPGQLYNKRDGPNVYAGCHVSYKRSNVTADNFYKVLLGNATTGGPVLNSTAKDRVFVYYVGSGAMGILGTPWVDLIHAADLNAVLMGMFQRGMYKELLIYVDATEAGSMFAGLLQAPNVKAVTSANPTESPAAVYCPPEEDTVGGKHIGACLGEEFSVNWMDDAEAANSTNTTLGKHLALVTQKTLKSHVMQYGDASLDSELLGTFLGGKGLRSISSQPLQAGQSLASERSTVDSRDVELHLATWAVRSATTPQQKRLAEAKLRAVLKHRSEADAMFRRVALAAVGGDISRAQQHLDRPVEHLTQVKCHQAAVAAAVQHCGPFTDYSMRHSRLLANLCEFGVSPVDVAKALQNGCAAIATCSGTADPVAGTCYKGSAGALGATESVRLDVLSFSAGAGSARFQAAGVKSVTCQNVAFRKSGQDISVDFGACLPDGVTVSGVKYCSDTDSVQVTVADRLLPVPITATLTRTPCTLSSRLVV